MSDWELMVPGLGLTVVGMLGVILSLAGIARTFVEGMHAISAIAMVFGMILLAAGILKDGLPRSKEAKAATIFIAGILAALGGLLAGLSTVSTLPILIGTLLLIFVPATAIAYAVHKESKHVKAIAAIFIGGSLMGFITFTVFSIVQQPTQALEEQEEHAGPSTGAGAGAGGEQPQPAPTGPVVEVTILLDSAIQGNPDFDPDELSVERGTVVVWRNVDTAVHTVASGKGFDDPNFGRFFNSPVININSTWSFDTSALEPGVYDYFCTLHAYMQGRLIVVEKGEGSEASGEGQG
ncbi:MAG: cupredoxin domain-containing protein [Candidatus Nitrosocaldus sp.]|nr:cupredoxin domain-containing protein [Candidatus Nitrosocaldus sp.]MDW8000030.1 cupredoxin domain-containing protein [Candidatus Nitrosocaldus sp.]